MTDLNAAGRANARDLIAEGKIDRDSTWSFDADAGAAILGAQGDDWEAYSQAHLGIDSAATINTRARFKYPFEKAGKVYRSALTAIRQRASQANDMAVFDAAGELLTSIDNPTKSGTFAIEHKAAAFECKFAEENGTAPGTFECYSSVFGNTDDAKDIMLPGAFKDTLSGYKSAAKMPKMLLNHGGLGNFFSEPSPEDLLPIGKWLAMQEDTKGLDSKGRLINLDTESGKRIYGAMKEGALDEMSIAYQPKSVVAATKTSPRQLKAVHLIEAGPVTFPANKLATIDSVKSLGALTPHDWRDLEAVLRDEGLSRADAVKAVSGFKNYLRRDGGDPDPAPRDAATSEDVRGLAARIRAAAAA